MSINGSLLSTISRVFYMLLYEHKHKEIEIIKNNKYSFIYHKFSLYALIRSKKRNKY